MNQEAAPPEARSSLARLPGGIWALGTVSMFMDISSEMIHGLLPVFLTSVMGASTEMIGLIEGLGEATASISKLFSGWLSDRLGKRKTLAVIGYGLAALSKPLFALAPTPSFVLAARFSDRVGKGIRGAPRDAMVGDMVPAGLRGAAYGLRQALDTVGAFAGPLIAIALMAMLHDNFRLIFWLALIPGVISVLVLLIAVREPPHDEAAAQAPLKFGGLKTLPISYWIVVGISAVLTLARFSEAFLILRAQGLGLSLALAPLVLVVMNIVYSLSAYPLGALSDKVDRKAMLAGGFVILIVADVILATAPNLPGSHGRRSPLGPPHGDDARSAGGVGRRRSAVNPARDVVWRVQFCQRDCAIAGEPGCGRLVGNFRSLRDLHGGRGVHGGRACRDDVGRAKGSAARRRTSVTLVTTFRISRSIAAPASANFGKLWALANLLIPVPLSYLKFLNRIRRLWCRNFK